MCSLTLLCQTCTLGNLHYLIKLFTANGINTVERLMKIHVSAWNKVGFILRLRKLVKCKIVIIELLFMTSQLLFVVSTICIV